MKYIVAILFVVIAFILSFCSTVTSVVNISPKLYFVCDKASNKSAHQCNGSNPEKGIEKVCLPYGEAIYRIARAPLEGHGIEVECGPKVK